MSDKRSTLLTGMAIAGVGVGLGVLATLVVEAAKHYDNEMKKSQREYPSRRRSITGECNSNNEERRMISASSDNEVPTVAVCESTHEGRQLIDTILPLKIDRLFDLLFSKSEFLTAFQKKHNLIDIKHGNWEDSANGQQKRTVSYLVPGGFGKATVKEYQLLRHWSKPGQLYSIDKSINSSGVMYAESFSIEEHYCLVKMDDKSCKLSVNVQIKYKEDLWGFMKSIIESKVFDGLIDVYKSLLQALKLEKNIITPTEAPKQYENEMKKSQREYTSRSSITGDCDSYHEERRVISESSHYETPTDECDITAPKKTRAADTFTSKNLEPQQRKWFPQMVSALVTNNNTQVIDKWLFFLVIGILLIGVLLIGIWKFWTFEDGVSSVITVADNVCRISPMKEVEKWHKVLQMTIEV